VFAVIAAVVKLDSRGPGNNRAVADSRLDPVPLHEMLKLDCLHIANGSLWNDIKILVRTAGVVAARAGL
jgi:lipopolysaccharide/colanic/teichoic acid biosynthesis glycosyltransferase